jgi:hypothetical protein
VNELAAIKCDGEGDDDDARIRLGKLKDRNGEPERGE